MCGILAKEGIGGQKETEFVGLSEEADEEPLSWANLYKAAINQAGAESFESVRSFTSSENRLKTQWLVGVELELEPRQPQPGSATEQQGFGDNIIQRKTVTPEAAADGVAAPDAGASFYGFKISCWQFRLHVKRKQ